LIQLKVVETKKDWNQFIDLPWSIYRDDAHWVPPLKISVKDVLDVNKNPFFKHATLHPLIALEVKEGQSGGGVCVGRIVAVVDDNHNNYHNEKVAFFGFLEVIEKKEIAHQLLDAACNWAARQGMRAIRGPMNPSSNHECGLLVDGFDDSPTVMMTYNPPYYANFVESFGFVKCKDLFAYTIDGRKVKFSDRLMAQAERLRKRGSVTFRALRMSEFDAEVETILAIYNDAWEKNWGFVPMDAEEFKHLAKDLKLIIDPELCLIAEVRGQTVGFALTLPDVNQALKKVKDGKLFPTGIFKLLWNLKGPGRKSTINRCRVVTLGIKKAYRESGIGPLLYTEYLKRGPALGYPVGEASWILEDNKPMNKALQLMCGERTKVYRIYDKEITQAEG
jgi:GNAT superfamily N-acetyltransferase